MIPVDPYPWRVYCSGMPLNPITPQIERMKRKRSAKIRAAIAKLPHGGRSALAGKSGVLPQKISDFANGRIELASENLDKLCSAMNL